MKIAYLTDQDKPLKGPFLLILVAVMALSFSPKHNSGEPVSLYGISGTVDTINDQSEAIDVSLRITDSGRCYFYLNDGEVLLFEPGYRFNIEPEFRCSGNVMQSNHGLAVNQKMIQLINAKFLYHE